jgi:hypothetical protein
MEQAFLPLVLALTSAALYLAGVRGLGLPRAAIGAALGRALEGIGLTVVLAALNVAAGVLLVLVLRRVTGRFVSLYLNTDLAILALAAAQAAALQWWMAEAERPNPRS